MHDLNWKSWGLIFVIALGVTFEIIKSLPAGKVWDAENLSAPKDKPYAARMARPRIAPGAQAPAFLPAPAVARPRIQPTATTPPPMSKEQLQALVAAHTGKPGETSFDEKGKSKKEDEFEVVIDPKTGKMVKRKKKKKVAKKDKKEEKKEEAAKPVEKVAEEDTDKTDSEADIDAAITNGLKNGELTPLPKNKADDPFQSAEDWIKLLLNRPSLSETNRFIDHYRKNLVNSETFYKVVIAMLEDNRPEMKKLGIHASAQVPNSKSFQLLANAAQNSHNDASVKAKAEEALNSYAALNRVQYLKGALQAGAPAYAAVKASQLLKKSAEQNLSTQSQSTGRPPNTQANQARSRTTYQGFLSLLQNLSQTAADAGVKHSASETLAALEKLLGSSTAIAQQ